MDDVFLAELRLFAGNFAPVGWALCDGRLLSINQNSALFSLLGTMYGGDGMSTFALPNLQGRVAVGAGQGVGLSFYDLGQQGGTETVALTADNIPAHNHLVSGTITQQASATAGNTDTPYNSYPAILTGTSLYNSVPDFSRISMQHNLTATSTGSAAPQGINNMQPVLGLTWIIATRGIFPPRP